MKKYIIIALSILFIVIFFLNQKNEKLEISFYSWKNSYNIAASENRLYIKLADIGYSNKLEVIKTSIKSKLAKDYVPVFYITNKAMKLLPYKSISKEITKIMKNLKSPYKEIQIDCDWSLSTKENYFKLLKDLKNKLNKTISVTIRLHQIKYFKKTGVPPVDYGVLMYYNMSDISDFESKNSILDNSIAKKYHYNFDKYPLRLKLALPLYTQAIQFRDKIALDIFEGVKKDDFSKQNFKNLGKNRFLVLKSTYFKGRYIYKNDIFRFEFVDFDDLKIALNDFLKLAKNRYNEIIFYTIDYKDKFDLKKLLKGKR